MSAQDGPRVAVCGTGRMGAEMTAALVERGCRVTVWNRTRSTAEQVGASTGATVAQSPADAAREADVVLTMLTDGPAVLATLDGHDGVLAGLQAGSVVVDCSTTGAAAAREAAAVCAEAGIGFLDSPVSGSTAVARSGALGLMVGGDPAVLERARPVLERLGTVVHVGPTGAGAAAKVAVNALLHTFSTALAECLVTAREDGVDASSLFDVLAVGVLWNRFCDYKRDAFTEPDRAPVAFDLRTAAKDLRLAVDAADRAGVSASVVRQALDLHLLALDSGFGDRDMAAMTAWFASTASTASNASPAGTSVPSGHHERN